MLNGSPFMHRPARGVTLIEVLVTLVILAFGLLGLAGLMSKMQLAEVEAYQRAQAVVLMSDMVERINANRANATDYVTGTTRPLGTSDTQPVNCAGLLAGTAQRDQCEWSNALKGAAETSQAAGNVGAMADGRGCVEQLQAPNRATRTPGIFRVTVTWQGRVQTATPALVCGDAAAYGGGAYQRAMSSTVTIGFLG
jgi:type IV pilus assembly protein PilV